jgi:low affinity Fe/Cu permease
MALIALKAVRVYYACMKVSRTLSSSPKSASSAVKKQPAQPGQAAVETTTRTTNDRFGRFAAAASGWLGSKWAFCAAILIIAVWAVAGPEFHYSNTWQLVINTGTTIVTFMMVFLIQNTQNRDARAINLKLNELIRALDKARDQMIDIENLSDLELDELHARYEAIRKAYMEREKRKTSAGAN